MAARQLNEFKKKVAKSYEIITASYHEAGHVLCALLYFMHVQRVEINLTTKSKKIEGLTIYYSYIDFLEESYILNYFVQAEICVNYSGLIAEKIFYKKISGSNKFPSFLKDGSSLDTQNAAKLIKKYNFVPSGYSRFLYKKKTTKELYNLLESYWSDIELVSHLLIQKKRIKFDDLEHLLVKKSSNKQFWKQQFKWIKEIYVVAKPKFDDKKIKSIIKL